MRPFRCALTLVGALTIAAPHAVAQSFPTGPAVERALHDTTLVTQIPGRWVVKHVTFNSKLTRAELTAITPALGRIGALLHAALGTLPGVEADVAQNAEWYATPDGAHVAGGTVDVKLWPYSVQKGKLVFFNSASQALFDVNHTVCVGDAAFDGHLGFIFAPQRTGSFHGFPMLDSTIVITHRSQPPCLPVSRAEVLQALAREIAEGAATADSMMKASAAERERGLTELAKSNPAAAANARTELAHMQHVADSARRSAQTMLTNALDRMSPAERASPAYLSKSSCHGGDDISACFVGRDVPDARAIVRENPAFFDMTRPTEPQLITLSIKQLYDASAIGDYPSHVMHDALERLDWAALSAMVH